MINDMKTFAATDFDASILSGAYVNEKDELLWTAFIPEENKEFIGYKTELEAVETAWNYLYVKIIAEQEKKLIKAQEDAFFELYK